MKKSRYIPLIEYFAAELNKQSASNTSCSRAPQAAGYETVRKRG